MYSLKEISTIIGVEEKDLRSGSMHELIKKSVNDEAIVKMPKKHNLPV